MSGLDILIKNVNRQFNQHINQKTWRQCVTILSDLSVNLSNYKSIDSNFINQTIELKNIIEMSFNNSHFTINKAVCNFIISFVEITKELFEPFITIVVPWLKGYLVRQHKELHKKSYQTLTVLINNCNHSSIFTILLNKFSLYDGQARCFISSLIDLIVYKLTQQNIKQYRENVINYLKKGLIDNNEIVRYLAKLIYYNYYQLNSIDAMKFQSYFPKNILLNLNSLPQIKLIKPYLLRPYNPSSLLLNLPIDQRLQPNKEEYKDNLTSMFDFNNKPKQRLHSRFNPILIKTPTIIRRQDVDIFGSKPQDFSQRVKKVPDIFNYTTPTKVKSNSHNQLNQNNGPLTITQDRRSLKVNGEPELTLVNKDDTSTLDNEWLLYHQLPPRLEEILFNSPIKKKNCNIVKE
ncbi:hypothetical protein K502DRAFT_122103 [Neoconidiobolus thromboides FSU 785]|nr:hypothetical protein K502DRAFT_122103 [Neoconidiobolus thromboides FSU 785]